MNVSEIDTSSLDLEVTVKFGWGSAFGGMNPYKYYDQTYTSELAADASTKLTALYNSGLNSNDCKYTVTIIPTVK